MPFTMLEDLFSEDEHKQYLSLSYPDNVRLLEFKLKEKVKTSPYYEVFAPLVHVTSNSIMETNEPELFVTEKLYVSNWGGILSKAGSKEGRLIDPSIAGSGNSFISYRKNGRKKVFLLQRSIASVFVTPPEGTFPQFSDVRFKDNNQDNFCSANLYWNPLFVHSKC